MGVIYTSLFHLPSGSCHVSKVSHSYCQARQKQNILEDIHTSCTDTFVSYIYFFCFQTLHITNSNPLFAFDIERNIMLSFLYDYYLLHTDFTLTIALQSKQYYGRSNSNNR